MLVSCSRRRSVHVFRSLSLTPSISLARYYSGTSGDDKTNDSLFSSKDDPWGHVFSDLDNNPPLSSLLPLSGHGGKLKNKQSTQQLPQHPGFASTLSSFPAGSLPLPTSKDSGEKNSSSSRTSIRGSEVEIFNDLFNTIFSTVEQATSSGYAATHIDDWKSNNPFAGSPGTFSPSTRNTDILANTSAYNKMRRVTRSHSWSAEDDKELERKRHAMEILDTDEDLLQWARDVLFAESIRYEKAAREAVKLSEEREKEVRNQIIRAGKEKGQDVDWNTLTSHKMARVTSSLPLQPPTYPHLLAHLLHLTTHKFHAPHLTLSLFSYARSLSVASRVLGCTKEVYYEYLSTLWGCFRDLRAIKETVSEMLRDGIYVDRRVEKDIIGPARRWIGDRTWNDEVLKMSGRKEELEEMRHLIDQIERLVYQSAKPQVITRPRDQKGGYGGKGDGDHKRTGSVKRKERKWGDIGRKWRQSDAEKWKADALASTASAGSHLDAEHTHSSGKSPSRDRSGDWSFGFGGAEKEEKVI